MQVPGQRVEIAEEAPPKGAAARTRALMVATASTMMRQGLSPSVSEVAEVAGVSRSTAYRYFPTRGDMLRAVVARALGPILERPITGGDAAARLEALYRATYPRLFIRQPISVNISHILESAHQHVASRVGRNSWYNDIDSRPNEGQIKRIVSLLRDDFEYAVSPRGYLERLEQLINQFTEEQFDALDLLEENDRVVFKGPAGTGKTFLAIEAAKRAFAKGKSVLFLCYNSLLGDWLKSQTFGYSNDPKAFQCRPFIAFYWKFPEKSPLRGQTESIGEKLYLNGR